MKNLKKIVAKLSYKTKLSLGIGLTFLVGVGGITPMIVQLGQQNNFLTKKTDQQTTNLNYDNQIFSNQKALIDYINQKTLVKNVEVPSENLYAFNDHTQTKYYNNKVELLNAIEPAIKTYQAQSNLTIDQIQHDSGKLGVLNNHVVNQLNLKLDKDNQDHDLWTTQTVYRGKNDQIYNNATSAKLSYFNVNQVYQFNGIYFRNQTDLRHYLKQYFSADLTLPNAKNNITTIPNLITIKNPQIAVTQKQKALNSDIFELAEIKKLQQAIHTENQTFLANNYTYQAIKDYIANNANLSLTITDKKSQAKQRFSINPDGLTTVQKSKLISDVLNAGIDDAAINYTLVDSNKGQTTYAVDVNEDDVFDLTGNYLYSAGGDILSITDKKQWNKVEVDLSENRSDNLTDTITQNFMKILINEEEVLDEIQTLNQIFNFPNKQTKNVNNETATDTLISEKTYSDEFELKNNNIQFTGASLNQQWEQISSLFTHKYSDLGEDLLNRYQKLVTTKRFHGFYKLEILYTLLVEGLVRQNATDAEIFLVRNFFANITKRIDLSLKYINNAIKAQFNVDILAAKVKNDPSLNFTEIFGFNNNNVAIANNPLAKLNNLKETYPNFMAFLTLGTIAITNVAVGLKSADLYQLHLTKQLESMGVNQKNNSILIQPKVNQFIFELFGANNVYDSVSLLGYGNDGLELEWVDEMFSELIEANNEATAESSQQLMLTFERLKNLIPQLNQQQDYWKKDDLKILFPFRNKSFNDNGFANLYEPKITNLINIKNPQLLKAMIAHAFLNQSTYNIETTTATLISNLQNAKSHLSNDLKTISFYALLYEKLLAVNKNVFGNLQETGDLSKHVPIDMQQFNQLRFFVEQTNQNNWDWSFNTFDVMNLAEMLAWFTQKSYQKVGEFTFTKSWQNFERKIWNLQPAANISKFYKWFTNLQTQAATNTTNKVREVFEKIIKARKIIIDAKKNWTKIPEKIQGVASETVTGTRIINFFTNLKLKINLSREKLINTIKTKVVEVNKEIWDWTKKINRDIKTNELTHFFVTKFNKFKQKFVHSPQLIKVAKLATKIVNKISQQAQKVLKKTLKIVHLVAKGIKMVLKFIKMLTPILMVAMEAISFLLDMFLPETQNFSYTYNPKQGSQYTWNGGSKTTMMWGLIELGANRIDNMQLVEPIKLQDPQLERYYYYQQQKFHNIDDMKRKAINDFLSNPSQEKFANLAWEYDFGTPESNSGDLNKITNTVIKDLANNQTESIYFAKKFYKYNKIVSSDYQALKSYGVEKVLNDVQPTWIVQLPNLDQQNYVIFDQKHYLKSKFKDDGSSPNFTIPGKVWDPVANSVNDDNNNPIKTYANYKYIIKNFNELVSAVSKPKKTVSISSGLTIENKKFNDHLQTKNQEKLMNLQTEFLSKFQIPQKTIIKANLSNFLTFRAIKSAIQSYKIYNVSDKNNKDYYFLSKPEAIRFYFSLNQLEVFNIAPVIQEYWFKNQKFSSMNAIYYHVFGSIKNQKGVDNA